MGLERVLRAFGPFVVERVGSMLLAKSVRVRIAVNGMQLVCQGKAGVLRSALRAASKAHPYYFEALMRADECLGWRIVGEARAHGYNTEMVVQVHT